MNKLCLFLLLLLPLVAACSATPEENVEAATEACSARDFEKAKTKADAAFDSLQTLTLEKKAQLLQVYYTLNEHLPSDSSNVNKMLACFKAAGTEGTKLLGKVASAEIGQLLSTHAGESWATVKSIFSTLKGYAVQADSAINGKASGSLGDYDADGED